MVSWALAELGVIVTCVGHGGMPVVADPHGHLHDVEAVIDEYLSEASSRANSMPTRCCCLAMCRQSKLATAPAGIAETVREVAVRRVAVGVLRGVGSLERRSGAVRRPYSLLPW